MQVTFREILFKSKDTIPNWKEDENQKVQMNLKIEELEKLIEQSQNYTRRLQQKHEHLDSIRSYLLQHNEQMQQSLNLLTHQLINEGVTYCQQQGLTGARIQKFHQFLADESTMDNKCGICLEDLKVGRKMMRLDCIGQHTFCQNCTEKWFYDHNTCPNCRYVFS